ncbi:MAG: maleylpyruvate isomerase N-terminal domain-containing protein [Catenulispora sp.]
MAYDADAFTRSASSTWQPVPHYVAYHGTRERVTALFQAHPDAMDRPVPACPGWTVGRLLTHLVENCRFAETNTATPELSDRPLTLEAPGTDELLAEWARSAAVVEQAVARLPGPAAGSLLLMDAFTHEFDARVALDLPLPHDHLAFPGAFEVALTGFAGGVLWRGLPTLRIETEDLARNIGRGRPEAVVRGGRVEVYRSLVGRRTHCQIAGLEWSADPRPWLPAFAWGPFTPPPEPVER